MKKSIISTCTFALISIIVAVNGDEVSPPSVSMSSEPPIPKLNSNIPRRPLLGVKLAPNKNVRNSAPVKESAVISPKIIRNPVAVAVDDSNPGVKENVRPQVMSSNVLNSDGSFEFILDGPNGSIHVNGIVKNVDGVDKFEISGLYQVGALQFNFTGNEADGFQIIPIGGFVPSLAPKAILSIVG